MSKRFLVFDAEYFAESSRNAGVSQYSRQHQRAIVKSLADRLQAVNAARGEDTPVDVETFVKTVIAFGRAVIHYLPLNAEMPNVESLETMFGLLAGTASRG